MAPRRRVLSDAEIVRVEGLAGVLTEEQLADALGIPRRTFVDIRKRDERVDAAYRKGRATVLGNVARNLVTQALAGNISAAIFYLKTQGGWSESKHLTLSGPDGGPMQHEEVKADAEAFARKMAALAAAAAQDDEEEPAEAD